MPPKYYSDRYKSLVEDLDQEIIDTPPPTLPKMYTAKNRDPKPGFVPISVLAQIMNDWRARYEAQHHSGWECGKRNDSYRSNADVRSMGCWKWLSHKTGLHDSYLGRLAANNLRNRWTDGVQQEIGFDTVDKILCAIDALDELHSGRLAEFYEKELPVATYEKMRAAA